MVIDFKSGEFVALRATHKFHVGSIERDIVEGEVVHFDGSTVKIGNKEHSIPVMAGAVRSGWLVPVEDTTTKYVPRASEVSIRPALSADRERGKVMTTQTVTDEERDLGTLKKVRDHGDGIVRRGAVVQEDGGQEGTAVGKIRSASNMRTTLTAENSMKVAQDIRRMDSTDGVPDKKIVVPAKVAMTGDVQEARSGDTIDDLLDGVDGVIIGKVAASGATGEGHDPGSTQGEKDDKAERLAAAKAAADVARAGRLVQVGAPAVPTAVPVAPKFPVELPNEKVVTQDNADITAKLAVVRAVLPKFEWDMTRPWKARVVDAVKKYGKSPLHLYGVMAVETETVQKHITEYLNKSAPSMTVQESDG